MNKQVNADLLIQALDIKKSHAYDLLKNNQFINSLESLKLSSFTGGDYANPFIFENTLNKIQFYDVIASDSIYWKNLYQLLDIVELKLSELIILLELNHEVVTLRDGCGKSLYLEDALKISMFFDIALPLFYSDRIDLNTFNKNFKSNFGKNVFLPTIYTDSAGSRMRSFKSAIKFATFSYGNEIIDEVLKSLQISQDTLDISELKIHLIMFRDFHTHLRSLGADDDFFIKMGYSATTNENNKAQFKQIKGVTNIIQAYTKTFNFGVAKKLDRNYTYTLDIVENNTVIIHSKPNQNLFINKSNKSVGSKETNLYRFGHIVGFPTYFDLSSPNIEMCSYVYNYDNDSSTYKIPI